MSTDLEPGMAFWLVTEEGTRFSATDLTSTDASAPDTLALTPGWNQIGSPFAFPVAWAEVQGTDRGTRLPMDGGSAEVHLTKDRPTARLKVIVGTEGYAKSAAGSVPLKKLETGLEAPYPNPTGGEATVEYALEEATDVTITVYDVLGRRVQTVVDAEKAAGRYRAEWKGRNHLGRRVASGVYFLRMEAGDVREMRKVVVVR